MASEIRVNSLSSRTGLSTVTFTDTGPIFSGITTFQDNSGFNVGTGGSIFSPASNTVTLGTNNAERLRVTDVGRVLINASSDLENSGAAKLQIAHTSGALLALGRDDSAVSADNDIGKIAFYGNDGGSYEKVAQITCEADGSHADGDKPGRLLFATTADGASTPTERLRIDSSGNLNLVSSSSSLTDLNFTASDLNVYARVEGGKSGSGVGDLRFHTYSGGLSEAARIDSSGRLLVGTTTEGNSAADDLTIATTGSTGITIRSGTSGNGNVFFADGTSGDAALDGYIQYQHANRSLKLGTAATEQMRIDSSGNVGINNSAPSDKLHVGGNIRFGTNTTYYGVIEHEAGVTGSNIYTSKDTGGHIFKTGTTPTEKVRIDNDGRMLIGTDSAFASNVNAKLQVRATSDAPQILFGRNDTTATTGETLGILSWYGNDGGSYQECASIRGVVDANHANNDKPTRISFYVCRDNSGSITESWRLRSDGGTQNFSTSTNYDLSNTRSAGNTYEFIYARNNSGSMAAGTLAFKVTNNGNVSNTNNSYGSLSDQRLKENIVDATSQWDDIKGLQIRKYNFRENTGYETHTQIGLIAQEAESISPGLVETSAVKEGETVLDADGNQLDSIKSINYSVLYMKSVKALQEAQTRIETLETQLTDALARITALEG